VRVQRNALSPLNSHEFSYCRRGILPRPWGRFLTCPSFSSHKIWQPSRQPTQSRLETCSTISPALPHPARPSFRISSKNPQENLEGAQLIFSNSASISVIPTHQSPGPVTADAYPYHGRYASAVLRGVLSQRSNCQRTALPLTPSASSVVPPSPLLQRTLGKNSKVRNSNSRIPRESPKGAHHSGSPSRVISFPCSAWERPFRRSASQKPAQKPHSPAPPASIGLGTHSPAFPQRTPGKPQRCAAPLLEFLENLPKVRTSADRRPTCPRSHAPCGNTLSDALRHNNQPLIQSSPPPLGWAGSHFIPRPAFLQRTLGKTSKVRNSFSRNSPRISQRCAVHLVAMLRLGGTVSAPLSQSPIPRSSQRRPSFVYPPSSILHPPSSILHPPSSILHQLIPLPPLSTTPNSASISRSGNWKRIDCAQNDPRYIPSRPFSWKPRRGS